MSVVHTESMLPRLTCVNRYYRNRTPKYWRHYFSTDGDVCWYRSCDLDWGFLSARNGLGTSVILPGSLLNPASSTFTNIAICRPSIGRRRGRLHSFAALPPPPCIR